MEDKLVVGGYGQPRIGVHFSFQLPRSPAGIAECENASVRTFPGGKRAENVYCTGDADMIVDTHCVLAHEIGRVQHEAAAGFDGAAKMHDGLHLHLRLGQVQLREKILELHVGKALVDDDAHGASRAMRTNINDALVKEAVVHARHRDQQIVAKGTVPLQQVGIDMRTFHGSLDGHRSILAKNTERVVKA